MSPDPRVVDIAAEHEQAFGRAPVGVWAAPGRVNLIGEHTDYNDGWVLPFALEQDALVALSPADGPGWRFFSPALAELREVSPDELAPGLGGWAAYLAGAVWALRERGVAAGPLDVTLSSVVPMGAGLSSSAALECAMIAAVCDVAHADLDGVERAMLARRAENEFVGAPTGLMDQAASTLGVAGHAMLLDCRSAEVRQVPLDLDAAGLELLVLNTNTPHALVDSEYAVRRHSCEAACEILGLAALRDLDAAHLEVALARLREDEMRRRVRHVVTENERVLAAVAALEAGDFDTLAGLLDASHASMRDDFEITVPTVDLAVETAKAAGALGARMTGGGFGGCIIALVPAGGSGPIVDAVRSAFAAAGHAAPSVVPARPAPGARRIG